VWFKRLRPFVNAGRLSTPYVYDDSPLVNYDEHLPSWRKQMLSPALWQAVRQFKRGPHAGELAPDVRYAKGHEQLRLSQLIGDHLLLLYFSDTPEQAKHELAQAVATLSDVPLQAHVVSSQAYDGCLNDTALTIARKYAARHGTLYLIRPDGHIAARGFQFPLAQLNATLRQAIGANTKGMT
jgi:hypothetical protein